LVEALLEVFVELEPQHFAEHAIRDRQTVRRRGDGLLYQFFRPRDVAGLELARGPARKNCPLSLQRRRRQRLLIAPPGVIEMARLDIGARLVQLRLGDTAT